MFPVYSWIHRTTFNEISDFDMTGLKVGRGCTGSLCLIVNSIQLIGLYSSLDYMKTKTSGNHKVLAGSSFNGADNIQIGPTF